MTTHDQGHEPEHDASADTRPDSTGTPEPPGVEGFIVSGEGLTAEKLDRLIEMLLRKAAERRRSGP